MTGFLMLVFGLIYAVLGSLSLVGMVTDILPGHEEQEMIIVVLAYAVALFAIVGGIASMAKKYSVAKTIGIIFALLGLGSLVYTQLTQDTFNLFDCIAMVLGAATYYLAAKNK